MTSSYSDISNAAATTGSGIISSLGIGSGLNVNSIISQLMAVQDEPVTLLQNQVNADQTMLSNYGQIKLALSSFQTSLQALTDPTQYQSVSATVGNTAVASATAASTASTGSYSLSVSNLAQAQTLITAGQASTTTAIGNGTLTFNFGTINGTATNGQYGAGTTFTDSGASAKTVTISSSDNSLSGIAQAINSANIGVTASIINDGTTNGNRLSLSVNNTGAANSLQISVSGDPALQSLLSEDPTGTQNLTQTSAAQNANFTLNGLAVTSASNTNTTTLPGVTLNLLGTTTTATTLNIAANNSGITTAVNNLVSAYNSIQGTITKATAYNSASKTGGPLEGQYGINNILTQVQTILDGSVNGAPNELSMLAQVGVTFNSDGTLSVNSSQLQTAITNNPAGVASMFASNGATTDSLVSYGGSSASTVAGSYAINVTQLATQGTTTGSAAASTTITAGSNDTLDVNLNGLVQTITLTAGTYTADQLATALQNAINTNNAFSTAGDAVSVTQNAGVLTVSSNQYGATSIADISGGDGLASLFGATPTVTNGLDVAGTINGQAATGSGQTLTSTSGSSSGLYVLIKGGNTGDRGTVSYTQGYANSLSTFITSALGSNGAVAAAVASYNSSITDLQKSITQDNIINAQVQQSLQAEYSALDVTMSKLSSMSTNLTSELASLASSTSSSSS